jgi:competence ComEA-like helix-hairpin-helix protein
MNNDKNCNSSSLHPTHTNDVPEYTPDARVEVLLFLGIIFWCWLLMLAYSQQRPSQSQNPPALFWNGDKLRALPGQQIVGGADERLLAIPATMTPIFFEPIPINFASAELLTTISGIGPDLADRIITTRNTRGYFSKPEDLLGVSGIGPSRMNQFAPQLSFTLNP